MTLTNNSSSSANVFGSRPSSYLRYCVLDDQPKPSAQSDRLSQPLVTTFSVRQGFGDVPRATASTPTTTPSSVCDICGRMSTTTFGSSLNPVPHQPKSAINSPAT